MAAPVRAALAAREIPQGLGSYHKSARGQRCMSRRDFQGASSTEAFRAARCPGKGRPAHVAADSALRSQKEVGREPSPSALDRAEALEIREQRLATVTKQGCPTIEHVLLELH